MFRLVIVNNGPVPCKRDLDAALQELGLFTGNGAKKLWSSTTASRGRVGPCARCGRANR